MTHARGLPPERRAKIAQIKRALAPSDRPLHRYMRQLDQIDLSAGKDPTLDVSAQQIHVLEKIRNETLRARDRLGALDTGLRAQEDLRKALIASAAGYAAWSFALVSTKASEITSAQQRLKRHFAEAADHSERAASHLERGI